MVFDVKLSFAEHDYCQPMIIISNEYITYERTFLNGTRLITRYENLLESLKDDNPDDKLEHYIDSYEGTLYYKAPEDQVGKLLFISFTELGGRYINNRITMSREEGIEVIEKILTLIEKYRGRTFGG